MDLAICLIQILAFSKLGKIFFNFRQFDFHKMNKPKMNVFRKREKYISEHDTRTFFHF